jgi:hypothetical protein
MSDLRFLKIHINYLTAAPILEILLEPEAVANPFSFYSSMESYIAYYRQAFLQSYRLRKGGEVGGKLRYPFVKGLGELLPLAGHEVKNLPLFRALGGNVSYVLGSLKSEGGMLPMKLFPNWKIGLDPNIHEDYELLTKFNCSPLVRIYPYGIASYQIKTSLVSERGIDLEKLITLMRSITDHIRHCLPLTEASLMLRPWREGSMRLFSATSSFRLTGARILHSLPSIGS